MYQAVANIPRSQYTTEEQAIISAIPDLWNDRNELRKQTIFDCALQQINMFHRHRGTSLRPGSYIDQILENLGRRSRTIFYYDPRNAFQVLYAMCLIMRAHIPKVSDECSFADNIQEFLQETGCFGDVKYEIEVPERQSEDHAGRGEGLEVNGHKENLITNRFFSKATPMTVNIINNFYQPVEKVNI